MKTIEDLKGYLKERGFNETSFFENPDFVDAIVGITDEGNLIYDYDKMIQSLVNEGEMNEEEAIEWIEYNTIRTIPYMGSRKPIITYGIEGING